MTTSRFTFPILVARFDFHYYDLWSSLENLLLLSNLNLLCPLLVFAWNLVDIHLRLSSRIELRPMIVDFCTRDPPATVLLAGCLCLA